MTGDPGKFEIVYVGGQPGLSFSPEAVDRVLLSMREFILTEQVKRWEKANEPPTACLITVRIEVR